MMSRLIILFLTTIAVGLTGCANLPTTDPDRQGIRWVQPEGYPVVYYIREDAENITVYDGLYLAPIIADPAIAGDNPKHQAVIKKFTEYFHQTLAAALKRHGLDVVDAPIAGGLEMRIAMTGVTFAIVDKTGSVTQVSKSDLFNALALTIEGEFVETDTDHVIAMAIDRRAARLAESERSDRRLTGDDFRELLDDWSEEMGQRLKEETKKRRQG